MNFNQYVNSMILSASGWRMVFAQNDKAEDSSPEIGTDKTAIAVFIGKTFADYIQGNIDGCIELAKPVIAIGMDTRPTGPAIADCIIKVLINSGIDVRFLGVSAAPEIMSYARSLTGFIYISASHNPIGHNGIKFGLNDGGVIPGSVAKKLANHFLLLCKTKNPKKTALELINFTSSNTEDNTFSLKITEAYTKSHINKNKAIKSYQDFTQKVITGENNKKNQKKVFNLLKTGIKKYHFGIVADMNGSARTKSIDTMFFTKNHINFYSINNNPGQIVHAIIPEPENLVYCASYMEKLQKQEKSDAILGYMPDCDGDRGNIVYWNSTSKKVVVLEAQEVFSLSVLAELAFSTWKNNNPLFRSVKPKKLAIAVNGPTSMRVDGIAQAFGAFVGRAEVGEANVVNKARELRKEGYTVPILGEGSNGGNITHPAAVRDPINTVFSLLKLLSIRDSPASFNKPALKGLFHLWCEKSSQIKAYKDDFTLSDIIKTLPKYITTGVSESRAILHIKTTDHSLLKANFQKVFESEWDVKKKEFAEKYGIFSYTTSTANGTKIKENITNYSLSKKGGLKITFNNKLAQPIAYMWMRGSGTEPVFRVLCDVKVLTSNQAATKFEAKLLSWETAMLKIADK